MSNLQDIRNAGVMVNLAGKNYVLKYDLNALAELEKHYGTMEKVQEALSKGTIVGTRLVLWAGLVHAADKTFDPVTGEPISYSITPYQVGSWIAPKDLNALGDKIGLALKQAMPEESTETANLSEAEKLATEKHPDEEVVSFPQPMNP